MGVGKAVPAMSIVLLGAAVVFGRASRVGLLVGALVRGVVA